MFFRVARPSILPTTEWFFVHGGDATGRDAGEWDGIIVLSLAWHPHPEKRGGGNSAKRSSAQAASTQKRMLKMKLKISRWTGAARKGELKVFHCLQQRLGLRALGRGLFAAEPRPHRIQTALQFPSQAINRFQCKRQPQRFGSGLE